MAIEGLHPDQTVPIGLDEKIARVKRKLTDPDVGLKDLLELAKLLERGNDPTLSLALHDHIGDQMPKSIRETLGRAGRERRLSDVLLAISVRLDYTAKGIADAIETIIREHVVVAGHIPTMRNTTDESLRRNTASFLGEVAVEALSRTMDHLNVMTASEDGLHVSAKREAMQIFAVEVRAAMIDQARANANEHDEVVEAVREAMAGDPVRSSDFPDYGYGDAASLGQGPPQVNPRSRYASSFEVGTERPENPVDKTMWRDAEGIVYHYDGERKTWMRTRPATIWHDESGDRITVEEFGRRAREASNAMPTAEEMTTAFEAVNCRNALPKLIPSGQLPDVLVDGTRWVDDEGDHWSWTRAGWRMDSARTEAARSRRADEDRP